MKDIFDTLIIVIAVFCMVMGYIMDSIPASLYGIGTTLLYLAMVLDRLRLHLLKGD